MEPSATKGFLMIVAFCGFLPEETCRTEQWMLHLDAENPHVIRNTAKGGDVTVVPLSEEGVLAWRMFIEHGGFDKRAGVLAIERKDGHVVRSKTVLASQWHDQFVQERLQQNHIVLGHLKEDSRCADVHAGWRPAPDPRSDQTRLGNPHPWLSNWSP